MASSKGDKIKTPIIESAFIAYDDAKAMLIDGKEVERLALAKKDVSPEVLYYLAEDEQPEIRVAVASNPSTPIHADKI